VTPLDVSVVLPVRNGLPLLERQLEALAATRFGGTWEVIVSNNGSTDDTVRVAEAAGDRLPIRVVDSSDVRGISHARNVGAKAARGGLVLFCDADDEVDPGWVSAMHRAAAFAHVLGGRLETSRLNDPSTAGWRLELPDDRLPVAMGHRPYAVGANLGARAEVIADLGGFDAAFTICSDDVDFSWRAQQRGFSIAYVPDAVVHYRLRRSVREMARQRHRYGAAEAALFRRHRADGLRRSSWSAWRHVLWYLVTRSPVLASRTRRGMWLSVGAYYSGRLQGALRERVLYW
jgi:GT2 family glycosyltransferase